jgi:hypothetical protein
MNIHVPQFCQSKIDNSLMKIIKIVELDLSLCLVPMLHDKKSVKPFFVFYIYEFVFWTDSNYSYHRIHRFM